MSGENKLRREGAARLPEVLLLSKIFRHVVLIYHHLSFQNNSLTNIVPLSIYYKIRASIQSQPLKSIIQPDYKYRIPIHNSKVKEINSSRSGWKRRFWSFCPASFDIGSKIRRENQSNFSRLRRRHQAEIMQGYVFRNIQTVFQSKETI